MTDFGNSFTIGTLSKRTGCSVDTIRYYERERLMPEVRRTAGGHRMYDEAHVRRLTLVRRMRALGLDVAGVRMMLRSIEGKGLTCPEVTGLIAELAARVHEQIEDLTATQRDLERIAAVCGNGQAAACPVVEAMLAGEDHLLSPGCCSSSRLMPSH